MSAATRSPQFIDNNATIRYIEESVFAMPRNLLDRNIHYPFLEHSLCVSQLFGQNESNYIEKLQH
jgi:hypothetical protein